MVSYSYASAYRSNPGEYVLKVHGQDVHDVFIQLGDFETMESWQACLNQDIMKQQQMIRRFKNSSTSKKTPTTIYTATAPQGQETSKEPAIIGDEDKASEDTVNIISDVNYYEENDLLFSLNPTKPYPGRRRSKSYPSILSHYSNDEEILQKYPLLDTDAIVLSTTSEDEGPSTSGITLDSARRKKRKTFDYNLTK